MNPIEALKKKSNLNVAIEGNTNELSKEKLDIIKKLNNIHSLIDYNKGRDLELNKVTIRISPTDIYDISIEFRNTIEYENTYLSNQAKIEHNRNSSNSKFDENQLKDNFSFSTIHITVNENNNISIRRVTNTYVNTTSKVKTYYDYREQELIDLDFVKEAYDIANKIIDILKYDEAINIGTASIYSNYELSKFNLIFSDGQKVKATREVVDKDRNYYTYTRRHKNIVMENGKTFQENMINLYTKYSGEDGKIADQEYFVKAEECIKQLATFLGYNKSRLTDLFISNLISMYILKDYNKEVSKSFNTKYMEVIKEFYDSIPNSGK